MKVRLNGWQRLWGILSIVYLLPVVGTTVIVWPKPETTGHRAEFIAEMPAALRETIDAAYSDEFHWREALKKLRPAPADPDPPSVSRIYPEKDRSPRPSAPDFVRISESVRFPNGAVLLIRVAKEEDTEADVRVADAYWAIVKSATGAERWTMVWRMALVWVIPCLMLYALGLAMARVRRRFRSNDARKPKAK